MRLQQQVGNHAVGEVLQRQLPGSTVPMMPPGAVPPGAGVGAFPSIPGEGFGGAMRAAQALEGEIVVGGSALGPGSVSGASGAVAGTVLTGEGAVVAEGAVLVGGATVSEGAIVVGAAAAESAALGGSVAAGVSVLPVVGIVVLVTGAVYLLVTMGPVTGAPEGDAGASLPGGLPQQPAVDPVAGVPLRAPAPGNGPAVAPGAAGQVPMDAPGIVDTRLECARRSLAGQLHDHHVFPQTFREEFLRIGIKVDDYTVTIPADKHIGANGVHTVLDWNGEFQDLLDEIPYGPLTPAQIKRYEKKAKDLATLLLNQAGMAHLPVHPYKR